MTQTEESIQELEKFSYSISHDLRAPLQYIIGFSDLLQQQLKKNAVVDEKICHYAEIIQNSAKRMTQMIDGLLELSRLGRNLPSQKETVDLNWLVKTIQNTFIKEHKTRHIRWEINPLPVIQGYTTLLQEMFFQLISNAVKFTKNQPEAYIQIGISENSSNEIVLFVKDNGVGFDNAYVDKLFIPFQRLHTSEEFDGIGMGLAKVHKIVRLHGGRAWGTGDINHGASFYFSIGGTSS